MPLELAHLGRLLVRGLEVAAPLWPPIEIAYAWVHRAAHLLANCEGKDGLTIQEQYHRLLEEMGEHRHEVGSPSPAIDHFLKVTASYAAGLFHCYAVLALPQTNNALEHFFASARYLERRATGRKPASPALVVRGSVRVLAVVASACHPFSGSDLRPTDLVHWRQLRRDLNCRHDPQSYLAKLEEQLVQPSLPP